MGLKVSTRNCLKGIVKEIEVGSVVAEVKLELSPGVVVTAIVSREALEELGLKVGSEASALIKATEVALGVES